MDIDQMAGVGGTITLCGRTFLVGKPTLRDQGWVVAWAKENTPCPYKEAHEKILKIDWLKEVNADLWKQRVDKYLVEAEERFEKNQNVSVQLNRVIEAKGIAFLVWVSVRHNHVDVTYEQLTEWLEKESTDRPDNLEEIYKKILAFYQSDPTKPVVIPAEGEAAMKSSMN